MNEPPDFVTLVIAVVATIASKEIASIVGPYAAIMVLACAGSALSLSGNEDKMGFKRAVWYVGVRVLVAIALTVTVAELIQTVAPWAKPRYTLIPLAFAIGWIRDYDSVRQWFGSVIERFTSKKIGGDESK